MVKMAIGEYWSMMKKQKGSTYVLQFIVLCCYFIFTIPVFQRTGIAIYIHSFTVVLFTTFIFRDICSSSLPIMLYLCPMEEKERVRYFQVGYAVRVLALCGIFAIGGAVSCIVESTSVWNYLYGVLHVVVFALVINLNVRDREVTRKYSFDLDAFDIQRYLVGILTVLSFMVYCYRMDLRLNLGEEMSSVGSVLFYGVEVTVLVSASYFLKGYYPKVKQSAVRYEGVDL